VILAFAHPCLVVEDVELTREFYEEMFGFRVISDEGWHNNEVVDGVIGSENSSCRGYMLAGHNCYLEMFEYSAPAQSAPHPGTLGPQEPGIRHLSFYVDDCRAEYQRCLSLGGTALGEPAPKSSGINAVYMRDPAGNIIELCEVPNPQEWPTQLPGINCVNEEK
jgi:glyoxylase I family protein